jgi:hypothetical protein
VVLTTLATVIVVLAAAGGSLLYTETASVKLSVQRQGIEAYVTLFGGPTGGALQTHRFKASTTESQQGSASTVQVGATYASGYAQFTYNCATPCVRPEVNLPAGTVVTNGGSLGYATQAVATINSAGGTTSVGVRATGLGASWNVTPGTLTTIASDNPYGHELTVTNPSAISGGADGRLAQVIQQADYDAVLKTLTDKVNHELGVALFSAAPGADYLGDPSPVTSLESDHAVGDETPSFTIKMSITDGATAFSELDANAIMLAALKAQVPPGLELTNDRIQYIYQSHQVARNAEVTVTGKADGFVLPSQSLRSQIRGLSPADAARSLQRTAPGSRVEIRISPATMPWLPVIADHISLTVLVEPARP